MALIFYIMDSYVLRKGALLLAGVLLAGCQALPLPPPVDEPVEVIDDQPPIVIVEPEPQPEPAPPAPPPLPPVSIVLTNSQPAYADVARELTRHFDDYTVYDLGKDSRPPVTVLRLINDSDNSRGIAALPPIDAQLAAWKEADPTVSRIGLILGEGHDELITEAEIAAQRHGIDLVVQISHSDQETLYFFRRMIRDIDGFWLLPDNRVLSARVLQQMLADAKQQRVPVSVPSDSMLSLGAMISMTTKASDIASTIADVVRQIGSGDIDRVPPITPLSEIAIKTRGTQKVVTR
jgi:hypothetical protein